MVRATVLATGATAAGGAPSAAAPPLFTSALWFGAAGLATERGRGREEQQLIIVRVASRAATEVCHRVWAEVTVGSSTEFEFQQIKQRYSGQYQVRRRTWALSRDSRHGGPAANHPVNLRGLLHRRAVCGRPASVDDCNAHFGRGHGGHWHGSDATAAGAALQIRACVSCEVRILAMAEMRPLANALLSTRCCDAIYNRAAPPAATAAVFSSAPASRGSKSSIGGTSWKV